MIKELLKAKKVTKKQYDWLVSHPFTLEKFEQMIRDKDWDRCKVTLADIDKYTTVTRTTDDRVEKLKEEVRKDPEIKPPSLLEAYQKIANGGDKKSS